MLFKSFSSVNFLWTVTFWIKEIFTRVPINHERFPDLPKIFHADYLFDCFSYYWNKELNRMRQGETPSLWVALIRTQMKSLIFLTCVGMVFILSQSGLSYLIIWLIQGLENPNIYTVWQLVGISTLVAVCAITVGFTSQTVEYGLHIVGI